MATLPGGTVTFLFTDIEGSTQLLQRLGNRYGDVVRDHRRIVRDAFGAHGGTEVDTQGDAFFYSFARARDAVAGAVAAQEALAQHRWPDDETVRVRMACTPASRRSARRATSAWTWSAPRASAPPVTAVRS